ncbi:septation protein A [Thalassotalea euphylliae]|uniref:Inner membrane-spanning protein YciB n=1 Tax=Thalassotalea euphylliae TaxID=1655234 RepID=A0A3E0TPS1_9GAMM|nr:septation protein A [Thalassotalea euphylliae]REL26576.1 septation protein A [Thalassotalea euphylliae]
MQALFEYVPLVLFFVVYKFYDIYMATGVLIVGSLLHILYFVVTKQKVPTKNWVIFGLIAGFGGLTIFLQDDTFLKWKVTIVNGIFAVALLVSNYVFKKNLIKQLMSEALELPEKIWDKLNLSWAGFFAFCGALNIYIAFNFSQEIWVNFKVFGLMGLTFAFTIGTIVSVHKHLPQEEVTPNTKNKD